MERCKKETGSGIPGAEPAGSDESWEGYTALGGSYSIDYMIGESDCRRKGFGKMIVVQPEPENKTSCGLLLSCGFMLDTETEIHVKLLP